MSKPKVINDVKKNVLKIHNILLMKVKELGLMCICYNVVQHR